MQKPDIHKHSCADAMWHLCPRVKVIDGWVESDYGQRVRCSCGRSFEYRRRTWWYAPWRWLTLRHSTYVAAQFGDVWVCVAPLEDTTATAGEKPEPDDEWAEVGA